MEENEKNCLKCDNRISDDQYYECDSCLGIIHKTCVDLSASEVKCMPLRKRLLLLICDNCKKLLARLPYLVGIIENMKEDIEKIKSRAEFSNTVPKSYSEVIKEEHNPAVNINKTRTKNFPTLIIKPKSTQTGEKTKQDLKNKINPTLLNIGIRNSKCTKQGNVVLKCETKDDIEKLKKETEKTLGNKYIVETPKMRMPKVKIIGYNGQKSTNELESSIRSQNSWIQQEDGLKVTYIKKTKGGKSSTIFIECEAKLFHKMMDVKKVYIDWERYPIYEDLDVMRCFHCQGFFHKSDNCDREKVCAKCGENHEELSCKVQTKGCNNCCIANEQYKMQYRTDHSAADPKCPSTQYHKEIMRSRTDYGY